MPKTKDKLPRENYKVKFRIIGGKQLQEGTYTTEGFKHCNGFICYTTCEVDYWNYVAGATENIDTNTARVQGDK